ncbi:MAG: hypothetical protein COV43_08365 [Deltaproteobacteria bacterium CG11_big_fil_rev_8_21_14_0_20_42_23]|nr:MAG: hypothetical protein COV43_08365 [Deltaproteobacteria bacterium CG11_big_fil_rev_8_21_14_0_20_42_23]PJC63409.1 MAG: hypothetical protein CO021_09580 [Deltaproteobacteria bacterium CG_4_9_14_0_2_um_filter_42_21]
MVNVCDVAAYILQKKGQMTAMKLQKLVYYCQAWSLVWDDAPLFKEQIEAWANGPVVRELYEYHRGMFLVDKVHGDPKKIGVVQKKTIDSVLKYYGDKTSQWLSDLTHSESPWRDAREGLLPESRGSKVITHAEMSEYYSSIT